MLLIFVEGLLSAPYFQALPPDDAAGWISLAGGVALLAAGGWLLYRGIAALGRNLTPLPAPAPEARMVEEGIYRRVRHPIYLGVMLVAAGWGFFTVSLPALAVAALLVVWLDLKARREEAWLAARYPDYRAYRRRTSRFLPGLY